jgi:hypothetical protein
MVLFCLFDLLVNAMICQVIKSFITVVKNLII